MIPISNEFKQAMKRPVKELQAYITGDSSIKSEDDLISFKISCDSGMCKTAMRKLEAKYIGEHNLLGQWVHVGYGVRISDGSFEYLDYGSFLVTEITTVKDTGITTIIGYDKMINSMKNYTKLDVTYPIDLYSYTQKLCNDCNLELGNASFNTHNSWEINQELWENIDGITYRDILVQIAQATGTTCIITNDDKVYFKSLTDTGETLTYDNLIKLKLEPIYGEINSVVLSRDPIVGEDVFLKDDESIETNGLTEFKISNNEIVDKDRENAITPIYNALKGISYYPFEATTEGLGWYEIGDNFNIINDTGDVFNTSLFNFSITVAGSLKETLKTSANTKTQTQYQYATTIAKRVKNTEILVNKQEEYIQQLVSDIYNEDGVVNENFTKVYQDINNIINNVQSSGGNNLIKNSVMFAYDNSKNPTNWDISPAGTNLLNTSKMTSRTVNGLTITTKSDGGITINGTATATTNNWLLDLNVILTKGTYTFSTNVSLSGRGRYTLRDNTSGTDVNIFNEVTSDTFTLNKNVTLTHMLLQINEGAVFNNETIYMNLQRGTGTTYKAYTDGTIVIDSNTESLSKGCLSGHSFNLIDKIAMQQVGVKQDSGDENKVYYTFSTRIKKALTGTCYVRLYNSNEEYIIKLESGEEAFYDEYEIKGLLPKDNYYILEFYGSADSEAIFTDNMLAIGEYKSQWTQANGEIMNTQVNVNVDGVLVKSSIYLGDYTVMSPLEFAGYSNINGTITKVFSLNKDITLVKKLEAEDEVKMVPIKIVPITSGDLQGWAFVPSN